MKAFISYSHADESLVAQLRKHLSGLQRTGRLTSWYDRKIVPGTPIDEKILAELAESSVILLVISADFMSSDYCMNVELEQALEQHKVGRSRIVPVIARPEASWTQFPFGKFLALPTDGKAVTTWTDADEAWVSVVRGIQKVIEELSESAPEAHKQTGGSKSNYVDELELIDTPYVHPRARKLTLSDLFVFPDLELLDSTGTGKLTRSADRVLSESGLTILVGDRQSGKTALLKKLSIDSSMSGGRSYFFDAKGQNLANIKEIVIKHVEAKLGTITSTTSNEAVLDLACIDNVDLARNIDDSVDQVMGLLEIAKRVFVSVSLDNMFSKDFALHNMRDANAYVINRLGVSKRRKLIEKWVRLGDSQSDSAHEAAIDRREEEINIILRRNVVPALPGHVLLVLQGLESVATNKTELTSYGHCYNLMIVAALGKAGVKPTDLDTYVNILTELSYALHVLGERMLPEREVTAILDDYRTSYLAPDTQSILRVLLDSGLMRRENGTLLMYRYVSGYFAGKYIADCLSSNDLAQRRLAYLADNAHNDDCALVLLFVCHHTKNPSVLETILLNLMVSLDDYPMSNLGREDFQPLSKALDSLPRAVLLSESLSVSRERKAELDEGDDKAASEIDDLSRELDAADEYAKLLRAVKAIEISGQLVRNRHGSLTKEKLSELIKEAIKCAQRIAAFVVSVSRMLEEELPTLLADMRKENPKLSGSTLESELRSFLMFACHFSLHAILRLLSQQLTNDALRPLVLEAIAGREDHFAVLLEAHILLKADEQSVIRDLQKSVPKLEGNALALSLLQRAVADRLQLFNIPFDDKQRIAEMFKIGVATQVINNKPQFGSR